jgi:hypothetical protein
MGPAVTDNNTGGPFAMFNKNIEKQRRKFVAANALEMGDPLNMDYCYERSRQCMHCIRSQTKLAAQKFNGCSAQGWVMLVHIPSPRNAGQVVWCLVWHTLKCILPPMPLLLPEEFEYSDTVKISKFDDRWGDGSGVEHIFCTHGDKAKSELRRSINIERKQAKIAYDTLRAVTRIQLALNFPAGHNTHVAPLDPDAPGLQLQFVRRADPRVELEYAGHTWQVGLPSSDHVPASHGLHVSTSVAATAAEYSPPAHLEHSYRSVMLS